MKPGFKIALVFLCIAALTQWLFIHYVPDMVHAIAVRRVPLTNQWINNKKTDARMRSVVLPNPDFVYSALFYDVSEHNIKVSGILPDSSYASVAFYDDRCQPYYVYNNLDPERKGKFSIELSKDGATGKNHVRVKTLKGEVLCRFLLKGDSAYLRMRSYQGKLSCE